MATLMELRGELDRIDAQLVSLLEERMETAAAVGALKKAQGLAVLDARREAQVLASRRALLRDPRWAAACDALFETLMAQSRAAQEEVGADA